MCLLSVYIFVRAVVYVYVYYIYHTYMPVSEKKHWVEKNSTLGTTERKVKKERRRLQKKRVSNKANELAAQPRLTTAPTTCRDG